MRGPAADSVVAYYALPVAAPLPLWRRGAASVAIAGLHLAGLVGAMSLVLAPEVRQKLTALSVRMLEIPPPLPRVEPPKPQPPAPARKVAPAPPPVMAVAPSAPAPASFAVAPQPEPRPVEAVQAPPAPPAPIVAARFDADYLQNPKPAYPALSRRQGEEGRALLRVKVSAQGLPLAVDIKQSSGFARLDEAALTAVRQWRFIPARQGGEPVEASVLVPLAFKLDS